MNNVQINECPKRTYVGNNCCKWYTFAKNPDISKFTMCQFCYEKCSEEDKKKYKLYDSEQDNVAAGKFNCDSDLSMEDYSVRNGPVLLYISDMNGTDFKVNKTECMPIFDVPSGSRFTIFLNTRDPELYITSDKITYNGASYGIDEGKSKFMNEILIVDMPTECITPSKKEIADGAKFDEMSNILCIKIQLWKKRTEIVDDIVPRSNFETFGEIITFNTRLICDKEDDELYDLNINKKKIAHKIEIGTLTKMIDIFKNQIDELQLKMQQTKEFLDEKIKTYTEIFGEDYNENIEIEEMKEEFNETDDEYGNDCTPSIGSPICERSDDGSDDYEDCYSCDDD